MADKKIICPLMGGKCIEDGTIVDGELHACRFWITVRGRDPNGKDVDTSDCSFAWMPMLLIENTRAQHMTGKAVEEVRNEQANSNGAAKTALRMMMTGLGDRKAALLKAPDDTTP